MSSCLKVGVLGPLKLNELAEIATYSRASYALPIVTDHFVQI
jgi:hypothetical protein